MRIGIWGAGRTGLAYKTYLEQMGETVSFFLDNNINKPPIIGKDGHVVPIYHPAQIIEMDADFIMVSNEQRKQVEEIKLQLSDVGYPPQKILFLVDDKDLLQKVQEYYDSDYDEKMRNPRTLWLKNFAFYAKEQGISGNVAECGVYQGQFAYYLNKYFPEKKLYLFDTFEGFDQCDIDAYLEKNVQPFSALQNGIVSTETCSNTSESFVLQKMIHPDNCIIKKGWFPDTAKNVDDVFCFVNLDMDLYQPMLAGLRFFYDRMCLGGVLLLHDYFASGLPGVKLAVDEFEKERNIRLCKTPIGDDLSLAIIKY